MIDKNMIQLIKSDYINQLQKIFRVTPFGRRNLDKIINCKIVPGNIAGHAVTDWGNNTITYGPYADECDIYHELDHIRKGQVTYAVDPTFITEKNEKGIDVTYINHAQPGVFFDEGITDYMAMHMFKNSRYFEPSVDQPKLDNRKFYSTQLEMLKLTAKKLGIHEMELCYLIDLKHHKDDNHEIDDLFKEKSNGSVDFNEFEDRLDFWGTLQKFNLVRPDIHFSKQNTDAINRLLSEANFMLEQIKTQEPTREM